METNLLDEFTELLKIISNKLCTTDNAGLQSRTAKMKNREVSAHSFAPSTFSASDREEGVHYEYKLIITFK